MSLYASNMVEKSEEPMDAHAIQTFHYAKYNTLKPEQTSKLFCVSKDDSRLFEFDISGKNSSYYHEMYMDSLRRKSQYWENQEMPPKEPMLVFYKGQIRTNVIKVGYSAYLTKLYGYQHTEEYRDDWGKKASAWNRVVKRIVNGDNMTKGNLEYIEEMKEHFGDEGYEKLLEEARKAAQIAYAREQKGK